MTNEGCGNLLYTEGNRARIREAILESAKSGEPSCEAEDEFVGRIRSSTYKSMADLHFLRHYDHARVQQQFQEKP